MFRLMQMKYSTSAFLSAILTNIKTKLIYQSTFRFSFRYTSIPITSYCANSFFDLKCEVNEL